VILADASQVTIFRPGVPQDLAGEAYRVALVGISTSCSINKKTGETISSYRLNFRATRAPSADAAHYTVPYFVAVTQGDSLIEKRILQISFDFGAAIRSPPSANRRTISTSMSQMPPDVRISADGGLPDDAGAGGLQQDDGPLRAMTSLAADLSRAVEDAFAAEGLDRRFGQVQVSDRPDLAQFQCNGALAAAKEAKANPRAIAEKIAARLKSDPQFAKVEIAGPGSSISISPMRRSMPASPCPMLRPANGKTLLLDFGGINVAKPMHVDIFVHP